MQATKFSHVESANNNRLKMPSFGPKHQLSGSETAHLRNLRPKGGENSCAAGVNPCTPALRAVEDTGPPRLPASAAALDPLQVKHGRGVWQR
jgi:hypothetical protein